MAAKKKIKAKKQEGKKKNSLEDIQNFTTGKLNDDSVQKVKELEELLGEGAVSFKA